MKITLESTDLDCYLITAEDGRDKLIQSDYDYPGIASTFGWRVSSLINKKHCKHLGSDGTVDCPKCGIKAHDFISSARDYLEEHDGDVVEDPGYFDGE
jgi:hypothetical protein